MKKILLLVAFSTVGLITAKSSEDLKLSKTEMKKNEKASKEELPLELYCQQYSITTWCSPSTPINDTVCYEPTNPADRAHAFACMDENARLTNVYFCGRETASITRDLSFN